MKLQMKPVTQKYNLAFDESGETTIEVRQITNGDEIKLAALSQKQVWRNNAAGKRELELEWNPRERERYQAFLTLVGADLEVENEKGETVPVFDFGKGKNGSELKMTELAFNKQWDLLPAGLCDEIVKHIFDCNPQWGDQGE